MKSANKSEKARITSRPGAYGWVVTIVVWLTGVAMPLNMLKVSILSPALMSSFNVGTDVMSSVMAMFYLVAAILAIPGGLIVQKIGLFGGFCGRDSGIGPAQRAKTTIWN
ncbi:MAG: hypothetical protein UF420_08215 [Ellagibacter isourolithinifaciens]|uniref:hypothetical protein n=1 Tax=Ellagibacter isourolithinifaciens TaxID=2137581 RepID=UPI002E790D0A|nr:hypothetical protein [Ellagibacter isourolithinifaciens]MEE1455252.1 hypothetical protein [Ellagibacter isourolithinifaciens]